MTFVPYTAGGTGTATISGAINGTNTLFALPVIPGQLQVYRNGVFQTDQADGLVDWDITWSGTAIQFGSASLPQTGDILVAWVWIR